MRNRNELLVGVHREDERGNVYTLRDPEGLNLFWNGKEISVPYGFECDGASVPRFFWRYVFPPGDTHAMRAAFCHDWIYRTHPDGWTKQEADQMFRDFLLEDGVAPRRARRAYWGVKLFGGSSWRQGGLVK